MRLKNSHFLDRVGDEGLAGSDQIVFKRTKTCAQAALPASGDHLRRSSSIFGGNSIAAVLPRSTRSNKLCAPGHCCIARQGTRLRTAGMLGVPWQFNARMM